MMVMGGRLIPLKIQVTVSRRRGRDVRDITQNTVSVKGIELAHIHRRWIKLNLI